MALIKQIMTEKTYINEADNTDIIKKEFNFANAYLQITSLEGNKDKMKIMVTLYQDDTKQAIAAYKSYTFTPSVSEGSTNFIQQGYEYLKTLPEFADAVDC